MQNHTVPPYKKTVLNKDEDYPMAHRTRSDPAGLKDISYTAQSEGTEACVYQFSTQNTVHNHRERSGHLATALMDLWLVSLCKSSSSKG